jgi:glycosyltransferase involved in cell wall biosynthesis
MSVTFLSCAHTGCGIGRYSEELSKALTQEGVIVNGFRKNESNERFTIYPYRSFRQLRHYIAPFYLNRAIQRHQTEIWQADYVDAAFAITKSHLKKSQARLFTTAHDAIPFIYPGDSASFWMYKKQLAHAAELSEKLIVVSEKSKADLVHYTGIRPEKIEVVYNGINHTFFFPDAKKIENPVFTVRYIGGLGAYKNVELLLHMAEYLQKWKMNIRIEIGGAHPERTHLPAKVASLGLHNVHFVGFIPDHKLRSFLAEADVFVYPSLYEGFGFPPLEAMACGTAVISSKRGSLGEVLKWGAITLEPTARDFADSVREMYVNRALKETLEHRALKIASLYTWQKFAQKMLKLYGLDTIQTQTIKQAL